MVRSASGGYRPCRPEIRAHRGFRLARRHQQIDASRAQDQPEDQLIGRRGAPRSVVKGGPMRPLAIVVTIAATIGFGTSFGNAQSWQMPPDDQRCPSKWGAADQRGSANMMKPDTVLRAAKLIRTGEVFELGAVLSPDPKEAFINAGRVFNVYTKPSPPIPNARQVNEELVVTELGQIGTQLDAFA